MAKRKSSLADAVHGAARSNQLQPARTRSDAPTTKGVLLRVPGDLHRDLRQLALDEGTSLQALGVEALERLLDERQR